MLAIASGVIWLIKTLIEHRRWSRLSKIQTDVHNKLLDRFSANEDLLAYIQTPAGTPVPRIGADSARVAARHRRAARPHPVVGAGRRRADRARGGRHRSCRRTRSRKSPRRWPPSAS